MSEIYLNKNIFITKDINNDFWYIFNKKSKQSYIFGEREAKVLLSLSNPLIISDFYKKNSEIMSKNQLQKFLIVLNKNGFLNEIEGESPNTFLKYKIGIFNPSKYIKQDSKFIKFFYRVIVILQVLTVMLAIISLIINKGNINEIFQFNVVIRDIPYSFVLLFISLILHEIGHMLTALYYKIPVPEIGIMFYFFALCGYADVSFYSKLNNKKKQINILLSGIFMNVFLMSIGIIIYFYIIKSHYLIFFIIINMGLVLANLMFYLKLDGYYIITILLNNPRLREDSIAYLYELFNTIKYKQNNSRQSIFDNYILLILGLLNIFYIPIFLLTLVTRILGNLL